MDYTPNSTTHPINKNRQISENLFSGNLNLFTLSFLFGTEIDSLANKTAIKEYHKHNLNHFFEPIIDYLGSRGNDVLSIRDSGLSGDEVYEKACKENIVIITMEKDFTRTFRVPPEKCG